MLSQTGIRIKANLTTASKYTLIYFTVVFLSVIGFFITLQGFVRSTTSTDGEGLIVAFLIFASIALGVGYLFLKAAIGVLALLAFKQDAIVMDGKGLTVNPTPLTPGQGQILWKEIKKIELIDLPLKASSKKLANWLDPSARFLFIHLANPPVFWETHSIPSQLDAFCNETLTRFYQMPDVHESTVIVLPLKALEGDQDEIARKIKEHCPKGIFDYSK